MKHVGVIRRLDWAVLGLFALGFVLRAYRLGDLIVFGDEMITLRAAARNDWWWLLTHHSLGDFSGVFAVYYQAVANLIGLDEWRMRLPTLLAGGLTPILVWRALRDHLDRTSMLLCVALFALSPILIHLSRFARPYAIVLLLEIAAAICLWELMRSGSRRLVLLHGTWAALALYLNLSAAVSITSLWVAAGVFIAVDRSRGEVRARLVRLFLAIGVCATLTALLYAPAYATLNLLLFGRTGKGYVTLESVFAGYQSVIGTSSVPWGLLMGGLVAAGLLSLARRSRALAVSTLIVLLLPTVLLAALSPQSVQRDAVFVRYQIGTVPVALVLIAIGAGNAIDALGRKLRLAETQQWIVALPAGIALVLGLALAGPIHDTHLRINDFAHRRRHFTISRYPGALERAPEIYRRIRSDPQDGIVIEVPWIMRAGRVIELYQRIHGREILLLTEDRDLLAPGFRLRKTQSLRILEELPKDTPNWVVVHLDLASETQWVLGEPRKSNPPEMKGLGERVALKLAERYGEPVYRDRWVVVFRESGDDGAPAAR